MLTATGKFETPNASKYLVQLCKHFAHKIEVTYDDTKGRCQFQTGTAALVADSDTLVAKISAETAETLDQVKSVLDKHLERFAYREDFKTMTWDS